MQDFYGDDFYCMVTVDRGPPRALCLLDSDARLIFDATDTSHGDVELWRLNGGYLCTPPMAVKKADAP